MQLFVVELEIQTDPPVAGRATGCTAQKVETGDYTGLAEYDGEGLGRSDRYV